MALSENIVSMYMDAFRQHGRSTAAVLCPKGRQAVRFDALLSGYNIEGKRILDFGCGLGHLCEYLNRRGVSCDYLGVDIVRPFIESNRLTYPERRFNLITNVSDILERFDFIVASGVFNLRYLENAEDNQSHVYTMLQELFSLCDEALMVDFMTTYVDFQQSQAFHFDPANVLSFALQRLGRRVVIDHSYLPFEFCIRVAKDTAIDRLVGLYV